MKRIADNAHGPAQNEETAEPSCVEECLRPPCAALFCGNRRERKYKPAHNRKTRGYRGDKTEYNRSSITYIRRGDEIGQSHFLKRQKSNNDDECNRQRVHKISPPRAFLRLIPAAPRNFP